MTAKSGQEVAKIDTEIAKELGEPGFSNKRAKKVG